MTAGLVVRALPTPLLPRMPKDKHAWLCFYFSKNLGGILWRKSKGTEAPRSWYLEIGSKSQEENFQGKKTSHMGFPQAASHCLTLTQKPQVQSQPHSQRTPRSSHGWPHAHTGSPGIATAGLALTQDPQVQPQMASLSHGIPRYSHRWPHSHTGSLGTAMASLSHRIYRQHSTALFLHKNGLLKMAKTIKWKQLPPSGGSSHL